MEPLARELEASIFMPLDMAGQLEAVFETIGNEWGLDFMVHSIAFSPKETLGGTRRVSRPFCDRGAARSRYLLLCCPLTRRTRWRPAHASPYLFRIATGDFARSVE